MREVAGSIPAAALTIFWLIKINTQNQNQSKKKQNGLIYAFIIKSIEILIYYKFVFEII